MDMDTEGERLLDDIQRVCVDHTQGAALYALCVSLTCLLGTVPREVRLKVADGICTRLRDGLADSLSERH